ncbi:MAG: DUF1842 domain-containing protein [Bacteroidota bacterium]
MSTLIIRGTLGNSPDLNAPIVNFNLIADPETHKVSGSVEINVGNPTEKPYKGNVTGTYYATGYNGYVSQISLNGYIPSNNPITPIEFGFNASMALKADGTGEGSFNFKDIHQEQVPVKYTSMNL